MKKERKTTGGFSLVEMIVVLGLFSIVSLVVSENIVTFYRLNGYTIAQAYQVETARRGIEQLVQDLREMTYADDGTFPLVVMEEYKVGFFSDIDRDDSVEYVEYMLSTTTATLEKRIFNATGTPKTYNTTGTPDEVNIMSEYVQNDIQNTPMFVYYDTNGQPATGATNITDIRYVQMNVIVNIDPIRDPGEFMLRSSASLRNLKGSL